jgi:hypothetical protein
LGTPWTSGCHLRVEIARLWLLLATARVEWRLSLDTRRVEWKLSLAAPRSAVGHCRERVWLLLLLLLLGTAGVEGLLYSGTPRSIRTTVRV